MNPLSDRSGARGSLHNPFRTYSNHIYPRTIDEVFTWALWLWDRNAKYRSALQKVVSYFVSGISVQQKDTEHGVDSSMLDDFKTLLEDDYSILPLVTQFGLELAAMGNAFVSAERIFSRDLQCPRCPWQMRLDKLHKGVEYEWDGKQFSGECPKCGRKVVYNVKDTATQDQQGRRIRFCFRDPRDMRVQFNRLTGTYKYFYKIPEDAATAIRRGDAAYLVDTPMKLIEAASSPDKLVEFPDGMFFSMRTTTLSPLDSMYKGWGAPLFLSSFDNIVRLQHLDKFNEAIVMDYIAPTRIISPQAGNLKAGVDDPNRMPLPGGMFRNFIGGALKQVKENPTTWVVSPVPVDVTMIGGDAKMLAPVDLIEWYTAQTLSDMVIPNEFRMTSVQVVAPSMGLRMFERNWCPFAKSLGKFTRWVSDKVADAHRYEGIDCSLDVTSFVEDDMNKQTLVGLMQGGVIAKTKVLKSYGVDFEDDARMRMQEARLENDIAMEQQQEQEGMEMVQSVLPPAASLGVGQAQANIDMAMQQAQGGMPPEQGAAPMAPSAGGAPMPGAMPAMPFSQGNSQSATIEQLYQQAQDMAQQLYNAPPNIRRQQLVQLKATNPSLHAQVKEMMSNMSQQVASDAVAQSRQPQG